MFVMRHIRPHSPGIAATAALAVALATGSALPASAAESNAQAQGTIENAGAAGTVPGSYIITLKDSAARSTTVAGKAVAERYGAKIDRTYSAALNGYSVELSEAQARKLAADPAVKSVVQNSVVALDGGATTQPDPPSWGLDRIDQRALPLNQSYSHPDQAGEGVTAYIIDTGVRITHSDFGGRAADGFDAIDNDSTAQDGNGHGTHVAATVAGSLYGVAKKAKIVGVRVLDDYGSGTVDQVVGGHRLGDAERRQAGRGQHVARRPRQPGTRHRGAQLHSLRNHVRRRGGQRVHRREHQVSGASRRSSHRRCHHQQRHQSLLLQLRQEPRSVRAGLLHRLGVELRRPRLARALGYVDGDPARHGRRGAPPLAAPAEHPGGSRRGPRRRCHCGCRGRSRTGLPEPAPVRR
ncbi:hypothetical protein GCM10020254_03700 [Streptomyces goshikiensis]